jgi:hypothetical protein
MEHKLLDWEKQLYEAGWVKPRESYLLKKAREMAFYCYADCDGCVHRCKKNIVERCQYLKPAIHTFRYDFKKPLFHNRVIAQIMRERSEAVEQTREYRFPNRRVAYKRVWVFWFVGEEKSGEYTRHREGFHIIAQTIEGDLEYICPGSLDLSGETINRVIDMLPVWGDIKLVFRNDEEITEEKIKSRLKWWGELEDIGGDQAYF